MIIDTIAVIIAGISLLFSSYIYFKQRKYIKKQDSLIDIQIKKEEKEILDQKSANIQITKISSGSKARLRISNIGQSKALNVNCKKKNDCNWKIINKNVLPLEYLEPGQNAEVLLITTANASSKCLFKVTWEDELGEHSDEKIVTNY